MKKYTIEIVAVVLAIVVLGYFWVEQGNKPEPVMPTQESQLMQ